MLRASGAAAELDLAAIPVYPGVRKLAAAGIASTLLPENLASGGIIRGDLDPPTRALLFDPQTAGGLLAGIPQGRAAECVAALTAAGYTDAAVIGLVREAGEAEASIMTTNDMQLGVGVARGQQNGPAERQVKANPPHAARNRWRADCPP